MRRQNAVAQQQDYTFLETSGDVWNFVSKGLLVPVRGNSHYKVEDASFAYARPAVKLFVERLGQQYHNACGERLVVTSLTRPLSRQPANASDLSVHPAGMAVDVRRSRKSSCRRWLERTLASLERQGVLDATRERRPPHYHVAIYPDSYTRYVADIESTTAAKIAASIETGGMKIAKVDGGPAYASVLPVKKSEPEKPATEETVRHTVKRGDTLWGIARRYGVTVSQLKQENGLKRSYLLPGQKLVIPGFVRATANAAQ
jgi:LysM repeat protein